MLDQRASQLRMHLIILITGGLSLAFVVAGRPFLSEKYSYDERKISALARQESGIPSDRSFQIVADTYRVLGLADAPTIAGVLGFILFGVLLCASLRDGFHSTLSPLKVGLLAAVTFLGAVYLGHYAKEVFILGICALAVVRMRGWWWDGVVVSGMIVCAFYFRSYWFIVAAFYVAFRILLQKTSPLKAFTLGALLGLAALSVFFSAGMGLDLDHYRLQVNDNRVDGIDAQTAIRPLVSFGGILGGYVNALAVLVGFVLPFSLLLKFQIFYVLIVCFCLALWVLLFRSLKYCWLNRASGIYTDHLKRMVALLFAFTVVQSIFEPDYGSYIRHLSPLLPLMLGVVFLIPEKANQVRLT